MKKWIYLLFLILLYAPATAQEEKDELLTSLQKDINPDSLLRTIVDLENFGTRFCFNPETNKRVAQYLVDRFTEIGILSVHIDSFYLENFNFGNYVKNASAWQYNVVATLEGTTEPKSICIVGAHLDDIATLPNYTDVYSLSPGADDNATGIALVLEIARVMKLRQITPKKTIRFMCFDAEEIGLLGSKHSAKQSKEDKETIVQMINADMVGTNSLSEDKWKVKLLYYDNSIDLLNKAKKITSTYTKLEAFVGDKNATGSDSYSYFSTGVKTIFLHEYEFSSFYHSLRDSSSRLDKEYLAEVTRLALALLYDESTEKLLPIDSVINKNASITLLPNPASDRMFLSFPSHFSGEAVVTLINTQGTTVLSKKIIQSSASQPIEISVNTLPRGIYICRVITREEVYTFKLVLF